MYLMYFEFAQGLSAPLTVPKGKIEDIFEHVAEVEETLQIKRERYLDNPERWSRTRYENIDDETLCKTAISHNRWVRWLYDRFEEWSKTPPEGETEILTPEKAQEFWPALSFVRVDISRWTREYYRDRMDYLYEVMRGKTKEGCTFDEKALTPKQAGAVIRIFSEFLDKGDIRLDVPNGCDELRSSVDGGYSWCEKCGPVAEEDVDDKIQNCRKRGGCPIRRDMAG